MKKRLYALCRDLGVLSYSEALEIQRNEFEALLAAKNGRGGKDAEARSDAGDGYIGTIFTVEHPAVYTLGKNGRESNLLVSEELLRRGGAEFVRTDRGGDITFHGEGQIVGYPVLDLEPAGIGLRDYIDKLEQAVIDTMADYGMECGRSAGASGVWLGGANMEQKGSLRKICAIGVRASRYVTMHGFALNVTTDLSRFAAINPCGFTDRGVTSMERELGYAPSIEEVKKKVITRLAEGLNIEIR